MGHAAPIAEIAFLLSAVHADPIKSAAKEDCECSGLAQLLHFWQRARMSDPVEVAFRAVNANIREAFDLHFRLVQQMDRVKKGLKLRVWEDSGDSAETVLRYMIEDQGPSEDLAAAAGTVLYTIKNTFDMAVFAAHTALPEARVYRGYYPWADSEAKFPKRLDENGVDPRIRPAITALEPWPEDNPRAPKSVFRQLAGIANKKHRLGVQTAAHPLPDHTGSFYAKSADYLRPTARWDQATRSGELARWRGEVSWEPPPFKAYIVLVDPKLGVPIDVFTFFGDFLLHSVEATRALEKVCRDLLA